MMQSDDHGVEVSLSSLQHRAIDSDARSIVVLAGAGSGKTEVLARRVQRLLTMQQGLGRVLALSYTNKSAEELAERFRKRVGAESERVTTETIHGFAHSLLRQHSTRIGLPIEPEILSRDEDRVELFSQWLGSQGLEAAHDPLEQLRRIDLDRARLIESPEVEDWRRALASLPALDYPGLLDAASELLTLKSVRRQLGRTYTHVVVDEAQNLTPAQYRLLTMMLGEAGEGPAAMLVGDDKQSIISFAGADPSLMHQFAQRYQAEVIALDVNFRSAALISEFSSVIASELGQQQSHVQPHAARGHIQLVCGEDESDEARQLGDWVSGLILNGIPKAALANGESPTVRAEEIAILGRSASALREISKELAARNIIHSTSSDAGDWLEGLAGKVVLELIALNAAERRVAPQWQLARLIDEDPDSLKSRDQVASVFRAHTNPLVNALADLVSETNLLQFMLSLSSLITERDSGTSGLASWSADLTEIENAWSEYLESVDRESRSWADFHLFCSRRQRGSATQGVQLLTVHKAQGREFRAVAIVGLNEGQIPDFRAKSQKERESELRIFYVAVTRARRVLLLSRALRRKTRYGQRVTTPSPYLELTKQLGVDAFE
ncbi:ATP-dependent helicase [Arthrobacter sp. Soc17.1.1.1]|uniref:ATP-dependent helicase n=1 Tax=Arthrobacter sp. Soc17.1.1.1 TaxID=3121277 RepID=UPI002FE4EA86